MSGYREQIREACMQLGYHGDTFDYRDVLLLIPDGRCKPTPQQVKQEMSTVEYLSVVERRDINRRDRTCTKYMLHMEGLMNGR